MKMKNKDLSIDTQLEDPEIEIQLQTKRHQIENLSIARNEHIATASFFALSGTVTGMATFHNSSTAAITLSGIGFGIATIYSCLGLFRHFQLKIKRKEMHALEKQKTLKR